MLTALVTFLWALIGSRPKVKSAPGRKSIAYSGFVIPSTGVLWVNKPGWFTYETVIESIRGFLKANPIDGDRKYYMVMDNAPWHRKAKRLIIENAGGIYQDIVDKVVFVYLPPRSPDLNPIEQVLSFRKNQISRNGNYSKKLQVKLCKSTDFHLTLVRSECLEVASDTGASFRQDKV